MHIDEDSAKTKRDGTMPFGEQTQGVVRKKTVNAGGVLMHRYVPGSS
jgi:hypothetical protein